MHVELTSLEARVIACLIEKQITTPEQYPLSLNALTNACNQKSNRDPVLELAESAVQAVLDGLQRKHQISEQRSGYGSRVPKYEHRFCNTSYGQLRLSSPELAIVCELLLRGPQTPGELRTRASRLCPFGDVSEVEAVLEGLITRDDGPLLARLPREPGKREARYTQLFAVDPGVVMTTSGDSPGAPADAAEPGRIEALEKRLADLEAALADLRSIVLAGNSAE